MTQHGVTLMKIIGFFLGAGSSILYALLGIGLLFTEVFWGFDPLHWMWILGVIGMLYILIQGFQVITMKMSGIKAGMLDIILSSLPVFVIIGAIVWSIAQGSLHGYWKEWVLYSLPVMIDMTVFLALSLIKFQLTSDVTVTQ